MHYNNIVPSGTTKPVAETLLIVQEFQALIELMAECCVEFEVFTIRGGTFNHDTVTEDDINKRLPGKQKIDLSDGVDEETKLVAGSEITRLLRGIHAELGEAAARDHIDIIFINYFKGGTTATAGLALNPAALPTDLQDLGNTIILPVAVVAPNTGKVVAKRVTSVDRFDRVTYTAIGHEVGWHILRNSARDFPATGFHAFFQLPFGRTTKNLVKAVYTFVPPTNVESPSKRWFEGPNTRAPNICKGMRSTGRIQLKLLKEVGGQE